MARQRWRPFWRTLYPTTPAAGVDWSHRNDSGGGWLVQYVYGELTTSVAAPNREPSLRASDGSNSWFRTPTQAAQAASITVAWVAFPGAGAGTQGSAARLFGWPTDGLWLPPGQTLQSVTVALDVADQWAALVMRVIEFPEVPADHVLPFPYLYTDDSQE